MPRIEMLRLVRKLMMLSLMVVSLAVMSAGLTGNKVAAATCCSTCENNLDTCEANCPPELLRGCPWCANAYRNCMRLCDPNC